MRAVSATGTLRYVMCVYNRVDGRSACDNDALLNGMLTRDWGHKGFVMSD